MESLEEWLTQPEGLAAGLKALRKRAGLTGKALAAVAGWDQSKVSRIEKGKTRQPPSATDIEAWGRLTGASPAEVQDLLARRARATTWHVDFQARMAGGQAAVQKSYTDLVRASTLVRHHETVFVPGPLQIRAYAKRILTEMRDLYGAIDDVDAAVAERMTRTQLLFESGRQWEFLLTEPVLYVPLCPPAVMREQLDRLQTVIGIDRVRFGIIPYHGPLLAISPQPGANIYVGERTVAVIEDIAGETWLPSDKVPAYGRGMDRLWEEAAEGDAARELIVRAARALPES